MIYCGIDYSYTSPAVCILDGESIHLHGLTSSPKTECSTTYGYVTINITAYPTWSCQMDRFMNLRNWALQLIPDSSVVAIEGYAFAAKGNVFDIGENTGLLKARYYETTNKEIKVYAPATVKKFATGKGNADKPMMVQSAEKELGFNFYDLFSLKRPESAYKSPFNDLSDALHVARLLRSDKA